MLMAVSCCSVCSATQRRPRFFGGDVDGLVTPRSVTRAEHDPQPSGLFEPDGETVAAVVEKPLNEDDVIAITIEPDGGSQQPTTDPMLTAKV